MEADKAENRERNGREETRAAYRAFKIITTRWFDNDVYGHVNNVQYYSFFDTVVNGWLIDQGLLDIHKSAVIGLVVETSCRYFKPIAFPQTVHAGLRVARLGNRSVRYEIGLFADDEARVSAAGYFVHVYVDRKTMRSVPLPDALRAALANLLVPSAC